MKDEAERLVRQMEEASENNKLLIQEYKEKNDTLTGLVNDFRQGYEESKSCKREVNRLTQHITKLQEELNKEKEILKAWMRSGKRLFVKPRNVSSRNRTYRRKERGRKRTRAVTDSD
ncbi:hypothetical protein [Paenibacillus larvae]|nr:hypothetical protein [Paenibacillus larvae]MCY9745504.1 hypothetical protein [Paenibacillus larvae]MCY9775001.1 hypothetical protein [Paenibacillus larvae]MEC0184939.1 hypothetical protein [Paenibacillus larvae]